MAWGANERLTRIDRDRQTGRPTDRGETCLTPLEWFPRHLEPHLSEELIEEFCVFLGVDLDIKLGALRHTAGLPP